MEEAFHGKNGEACWGDKAAFVLGVILWHLLMSFNDGESTTTPGTKSPLHFLSDRRCSFVN